MSLLLWTSVSVAAMTPGAFETALFADLPAATTIDAFAEVPIGRGIAVVVRGENLTGETIVTRNQGGSIDLGTPRTGWGGVRFSL